MYDTVKECLGFLIGFRRDKMCAIVPMKTHCVIQNKITGLYEFVLINDLVGLVRFLGR